MRGADGQVVPGSLRQLLSFAPLSRATGYVLRPENRWTQPVVSFAPDEIIYATGRTEIFVQPLPVVEYSARSYARLFRPQSVVSADPAETMWVPGEVEEIAAPGATLNLTAGNELVEAVPSLGYRVNQVPGSERGYTIDEFRPEAGSPMRPDFTAMRVGANTRAAEVRS
jgi:hypothetical protein